MSTPSEGEGDSPLRFFPIVRSTYVILCYRCNRDRTLEDLTVDGISQPDSESDAVLYCVRRECPECLSHLCVAMEVPECP